MEQAAIELLREELGWPAMSAREEVLGAQGTLARDTKADVVLVPRLRAAIGRLNPKISSEGISAAVNELTRDRSAMSLVTANAEVNALLKDGVPVSVRDPEHGGQRIERARVIDWMNPAGNDFIVVSQMTVTGQLYTIRPDLVCFVNGLPVVVIEFKKPAVAARHAFEDNLRSYVHPQNGAPQLFWPNALLVASNGTESRVGTITADWDRFSEWKRVEREDEPRRVSLEVVLRGVLDKSRLLDLIENFTLFAEQKGGLAKILAQNHQFLGVNRTIDSMLAARERGDGRGGVFWQTQGSGKSVAMVFFSQKVLRKVPGNWTFVIVTDRVELDDQIARTFKACGAVSEAEGDESHAQTGEELRQLLRGNRRYVFTLIQKFRSPEVLSDRRDIVVLTDEAHRTQYDALALNMRASLPNATFLAFTGTPLIAGEERTREVFGDYVSVYDFQQSVEDGATVPLFYENRTPELRLENPDLNDDLYALVEAAQLDEEQERRLERELGRQYYLLTRDDRLETVAADLVQHFLGRGFQGKAMVVSIDKATAVRMYDKVRRQWEAERARIERELAALDPADDTDAVRLEELRRLLDLLRTTDMAVVVSAGQNEVEDMRRFGLDIVPHRRRMLTEALDEKFKDSADPLRLVFVCAMWMTGFDVPSCSTIYLDKPMRNHTLMQTIARANRVFPGKQSGLIVDYANVLASLERALAIYGTGRGGDRPVRAKEELLAHLHAAVDETVSHCAAHGVDLTALEDSSVSRIDRLSRFAAAVEALISPDAERESFLAHVQKVRTLYDAAKPDPAVLDVAPALMALEALAVTIDDRLGHGTGAAKADILRVMADVNRLLDESIAADGFQIREPKGTYGPSLIDLSAIDFEALAKRFAKSQRKNMELEQLRAAVGRQLNKLVRFNRTRADYQAKFEELIASYNAGSRTIEELFQELLTLSRALTDEEQRHVREQLTEEELTIFDVLTRPDPELSMEERDVVKKVTRQLLARLHEVLVLDWRKQVAARARVRETIAEVLDVGLPAAYTPDVYQRKVAALFNHIFESYRGARDSVFTQVA